MSTTVRTSRHYDDWSASLTDKQKAAVVYHIKLLAHFGHLLRTPHSKVLTGGKQGFLSFGPLWISKKSAFSMLSLTERGYWLAGVKSGTSERRFYGEHLKKAQHVFSQVKGEEASSQAGFPIARRRRVSKKAPSKR